MRGKAKIVAAILALMVLVAGLMVGGTALAQEPTPTPFSQAGEPVKTLWARVAAILEIDEQLLLDAVREAQQELVDEAIANRLAQLVEKGVITETQAAQIGEWLGQRPGFLPQVLAPRLGRFLGGMMWGKLLLSDAPTEALISKVAGILEIEEQELIDAIKQAQQEMRAEAFDQWLDKLVEKGVITQGQADQIRGWWSQRPDFLPQGLQPFPRMRGMIGRGHGMMNGGWDVIGVGWSMMKW